MKGLFIVFIACLLYSCTGKNNTIEKSETLYKQALIVAQRADQTENELFLGFKFGMTEAEVRKHMEKLEKDKKVYVNDNSSYQYDFLHSSGLKLYLNFRPKFHDGKLYEMVYPISNPIGLSSGNYVFITSAFSDSERKSGFSNFIVNDAMGEPSYIYIKGNLIITFGESGSDEMRYTNAPIAKIVKAAEEKERKAKAKESYSDF